MILTFAGVPTDPLGWTVPLLQDPASEQIHKAPMLHVSKILMIGGKKGARGMILAWGARGPKCKTPAHVTKREETINENLMNEFLASHVRVTQEDHISLCSTLFRGGGDWGHV